MLVLILLAPAAPAAAQPPARAGDDDEPIGWPLDTPHRPKPDRMPLSPAAPVSASVSGGKGADEEPAPSDAAPLPAEAARSADEEELREPLSAPLPSVISGAAPLLLRFGTDEYAPTRDQVHRLSRLAASSRIGQGRIDILSWAAGDGEGGEARRAALERALARALAIRDLLHDEGIALARIDVTALLGPPPQEADVRHPPREGVRVRITPDLIAGVR